MARDWKAMARRERKLAWIFIAGAIVGLALVIPSVILSDGYDGWIIGAMIGGMMVGIGGWGAFSTFRFASEMAGWAREGN